MEENNNVNETNELAEENKRLKAALSKSNTENAEWKRKYQSRLSEEELAETKRAEEQKARDDENAKKDELIKLLTRQNEVTANKAGLIKLGMDETLANDTAEAMADGKFSTVIGNMALFKDSHEQKIREAMLNGQPTLSVGKTPDRDSIDDEQRRKLRQAMGL